MNDKQKNGWQLYFDNNYAEYEQETFTYHTLQEVDFIEEEIKGRLVHNILDVGCGTGRHSLELARRGYNVTGIDISANMLHEAQTKANAESLINVNFVEADAHSFQLDKKYDLALCLCEGAFGLLSEGDDPYERDLQILQNINQHLNSGAKLIMTVLNALRTIRLYSDEEVAQGLYDNLTLSEIYPISNLDNSLDNHLKVREKAFTAPELYLMLKNSGFKLLHFWGGTAGNWQRKALQMNEMEIMVIAEKI